MEYNIILQKKIFSNILNKVSTLALSGVLLSVLVPSSSWAMNEDKTDYVSKTPPYILKYIFSFLDIKDLGRLTRVSKKIQKQAEHKDCWKNRVLGADTKEEVKAFTFFKKTFPAWENPTKEEIKAFAHLSKLMPKKKYSLLLMSENPSDKDLKKIKPGELAVYPPEKNSYWSGKFIYCKIAGKGPLWISERNLPSTVFNKFFQSPKKITPEDEKALLQYTSSKEYTFELTAPVIKKVESLQSHVEIEKLMIEDINTAIYLDKTLSIQFPNLDKIKLTFEYNSKFGKDQGTNDWGYQRSDWEKERKDQSSKILAFSVLKKEVKQNITSSDIQSKILDLKSSASNTLINDIIMKNPTEDEINAMIHIQQNLKIKLIKREHVNKVTFAESLGYYEPSITLLEAINALKEEKNVKPTREDIEKKMKSIKEQSLGPEKIAVKRLAILNIQNPTPAEINRMIHIQKDLKISLPTLEQFEKVIFAESLGFNKPSLKTLKAINNIKEKLSRNPTKKEVQEEMREMK